MSAPRRGRSMQSAEPQYSITFFYPSGARKSVIRMGGALGHEYEIVAYFPNGRLEQVEHGSVDKLLEYLKEQSRKRSGPSSGGAADAETTAR